MTVIDVVTCPSCGDEHRVICNHEGKQCGFCGRVFDSNKKAREHEEDCDPDI